MDIRNVLPEVTYFTLKCAVGSAVFFLTAADLTVDVAHFGFGLNFMCRTPDRRVLKDHETVWAADSTKRGYVRLFKS